MALGRIGHVLGRSLDRPGSRLLFPALCVPTGELSTAATEYPRTSERGMAMPKRRRTRQQDRARRIDAERALNGGHVAERNKPRRSNRPASPAHRCL